MIILFEGLAGYINESGWSKDINSKG